MAAPFGLLFILVGLLAGWLYGSISRSRPYGVIADLFGGAIGGVLGGWLFPWFGIPTHSLFWTLMSSLLAACVLLLIMRLARRLANAERRGR